jgi:hypothetical protein
MDPTNPIWGDSMQRILILGLTAVLALSAATAALATHRPGHPAKPAKPAKAKTQQQGQSGGKVTICHRTFSETNPHRTLRVAMRAWNQAHSKHGDQMGACQNGQPAATTEAATTLTAVAGATGTGTFHVDVRLLKNRARVCYTLTTEGVQATAAHIHTSVAQTIGGTAYTAGAIVVPLKTPRSGASRGCVNVSRAIGEELRSSPGEFYVNVHSTAFPNGQIQGTLATA